MKWEELRTPCAIVDLDKVEANCSRMADRISGLGVRLRPHVKTHKTVEAARLQVRGHFGGITVSTLAEANFYSTAGFGDITYAVPIAVNRIEDAVELSHAGILNLLLDHEQTFFELEKCAQARNVRFSVFLKVDCGYHRAGVDPLREQSVELASKLARSPHIDFRGILTHAGHSYACRTANEIRQVGIQEREVMVNFAQKLRVEGMEVPEVSVGSTPTMSLAEGLEGVTEARPGNYIFFDAFQAGIGSCEISDASFSVLVSVIGQYPKRNQLLIDAGALSFSKDAGPTHLAPDCGYGALFSEDGSKLYSDLRLFSLSQEVGKVAGTEAIDFEELAVGTRLRVVPNHSCLSAALFPCYYVIRDGQVVDEWTPVRGW
jgi:D-serine deaminase-like pyridoxal phosphate-dependent protein